MLDVGMANSTIVKPVTTVTKAIMMAAVVTALERDRDQLVPTGWMLLFLGDWPHKLSPVLAMIPFLEV